jgi:hypothetical protein
MTDQSRGDRYALAALKRRRGLLATEIAQLEGQLRHRKAMLGHVDATLKLLDPSVVTDAIPRRRPKRIKLFRQGELGRLILGALREADRPLATAEIVAAVLAAGGHGDGARTALAPRVRGNLAYLEGRGRIRKIESGTEAQWTLR